MQDIKNKYKILHDKTDKARWFVKLKKSAGIFAGLMYGYGKFEVKEPTTPEGNAVFSFERDILHVPESIRGLEMTDVQEKEFNHLLGTILHDILQDNLNKVSTKDDRLVLELDNDQ
jgi:hypothetical protein